MKSFINKIKKIPNEKSKIEILGVNIIEMKNSELIDYYEKIQTVKKFMGYLK
jgi:hemerythrin superfamily protein